MPSATAGPELPGASEKLSDGVLTFDGSAVGAGLPVIALGSTCTAFSSACISAGCASAGWACAPAAWAYHLECSVPVVADRWSAAGFPQR